MTRSRIFEPVLIDSSRMRSRFIGGASSIFRRPEEIALRRRSTVLAV
jgi:hypothetical protein